MKKAAFSLRSFLLVGAIASGFATPSWAALSPYWQSAAEMKAILSSPAVNEALKTEDNIVSVTRTGKDKYEIRTEVCILTVTIVDVPAPPGKPIRLGPRQFDLAVGEAKCR